jgi:sulfur-oxidizing protein SoxX
MRPFRFGPVHAAFAVVACTGSLAAQAQDVVAGRDLFVRKDKGNCVACHEVPSDTAVATHATVGPSLSGVRERHPDRSVLRELLVDPMRRNPATLMPPYGRHQILSAAEIERVIDYLHALR